jgi:16S rRNA (cytidine1402-2'-O)-methyltransferase
MKTLLSHHEHNTKERVPEIVSLLKAGKSVAVVSDAGTPGVSDPGRQLADQCLIEGIPIHPIPGHFKNCSLLFMLMTRAYLYRIGPSAVASAISVCGYGTDFTFLGFLPVKGVERTQKMRWISTAPHAVVLYESPHRVLVTAEDIDRDISG